MADSPAMAHGETRIDGELPEEDLALLTRLAEWVVERRMAVPAILFLESHRPLSFVGSQALLVASPAVDFFEPFIRGLVGRGFTYADFRRFAELMEERDNLETLVVEIERANQRAKEREKAEKERKRALKREVREQRKALRKARREGRSGGDT